MADEIDRYLGSNENPEAFKQAVFMSFDNTQHSFFFVRVLFSRIKRLITGNRKSVHFEKVKKVEMTSSKEQISEFSNMMFNCVVLSICRSPLSSFLVIIIMLLWFIAKSIVNDIKPDAIKSGLVEVTNVLKAHN
ncbi:hypothetical protein [Pseudoalteromonas aurantia]|uniref:hypothetical protein n=1 Tax=Pseudoalteromonas aurantia TaxID=43654 RepID=UPI001788512D|nr:hypothetical protein [Pseudoalteromonas aurantia]